MSREIKFRAWDENEKNFLYFGYKEGLISHCDDQYQKLNIKFIEQFTGLHDKNRKEIYEGDIIKYHFYNGHDHLRESIAEVKYSDADGSYYAVSIPDNDFCYMSVYVPGSEVIGNIYENPELREAPVCKVEDGE